MAITSHAWFLFTGMVGTVSTYFVLDGLGFDAFALGVTYALGGAVADALGSRTALWIAVAGLLGQAIAISCSPLRHARIPDTDTQLAN